MKFIGQFIQNVVARFRSDVFLENIADGTVANDKFLGLDSNNKIVKETVTSSSGDITRVKFTADTTEEISQTSGNADFIISGGNAIGTDINDSTGAIEINHDDTSSQASVNNSGRTFIQDITLDTYGHVTGITSATDSDTHTGDITSVGIGSDSLGLVFTSGDVDFTIAGGNAITTAGSSGGGTNAITINHDDTSSQASVNNSGRTYIQDITLDTYGHVTGLTSATETVTNTDANTTYNLSAVDGDDAASRKIRLEGDDETIDDITLVASTGLSIARASNKITLTNTVTNTDTQLTTEQVQDIAGPLVATGGTKTNISVTYDDANNDMDFIVPDAETGAKGVVELATTGEADTGTDTARAVTPAGLKSHVDARFTYQYVTFIGNADIGTNWATPGTNGPFTHNYNTDTGVNGTSVGSTTHNFARAKQLGFVVPYDSAVLVGFYGMIRNNTANNQGALGLFHSTYATFGAKTTTSTFTLQAYAVADQTGGAGTSYQGFTKVVDLNRNLDLTAGDMIIPAILQANEKAYASFTIVIKTPII
jgi:hypothetical protein